MFRVLLLICTLLLGACADRVQVPAQIPHLKLPVQMHVQREQAGQRSDLTLILTKRQHGLRWSLTDASGHSLAQQEQTNDGWKKNESELPVDYDARDLFSATLFALTSEKELRFLYPGVLVQPHGRSFDEQWNVSYASEGIIRIALPDGLTYILSPVSGKATR